MELQQEEVNLALTLLTDIARSLMGIYEEMIKVEEALRDVGHITHREER